MVRHYDTLKHQKKRQYHQYQTHQFSYLDRSCFCFLVLGIYFVWIYTKIDLNQCFRKSFLIGPFFKESDMIGSRPG